MTRSNGSGNENEPDWQPGELAAWILAQGIEYSLVTGPRCSGKSTLLPGELLLKGCKVLVVCPFMEAAYATALYMSQILGEPLGETVGFRSQFLNVSSRKTRLLYCTDEPNIVLESLGQGRYDTVIVDDMHEYTTNSLIMEAWCYRAIRGRSTTLLRMIVASATLNVRRMAARRQDPPVFRLEGHGYPIKNVPSTGSLEGDIRARLQEGYDVLAFAEDPPTAYGLLDVLEDTGADISVFRPDQHTSGKDRVLANPEKQSVVFSFRSLGCGITLVPAPGRELAVIDLNVEQVRLRIAGGGMYWESQPLAHSRSVHRRNRTGRVGPGVYTCRDLPGYPTGRERPEEELPGMFRQSPEAWLLHLVSQGIDPQGLPLLFDFPHPVKEKARHALFLLGACDELGRITLTGQEMQRLSIEPFLARMILAAREEGVLEYVAVIASIIQIGVHWLNAKIAKKYSAETQSNLLVALDVFIALSGMEEAEQQQACKSLGVNGYALANIVKQARAILGAVSGKALGEVELGSFAPPDPETRERILHACLAGLVGNLYRLRRDGRYKRSGETALRTLAASGLSLHDSEWLVGLPISFTGHQRRGSRTVDALWMESAVDPQKLADHFPALDDWSLGSPVYDPVGDRVIQENRRYFAGQLVGTQEVEVTTRHGASQAFCAWLCGMICSSKNPASRKMDPALLEVIRQNREFLAKAAVSQEFAGYDVAPLYDPDELCRLMLPMLNGITAAADDRRLNQYFLISAIPPLRLRPKSQHRPSEVGLRGQLCPVEYPERGLPRIGLTQADFEFGALDSISPAFPDGRSAVFVVRLPDGSVVESPNVRVVSDALRAARGEVRWPIVLPRRS